MPSDLSAEIVDWALGRLAQDEDIIVPVKKLWNEWHARHGAPPLEAFARILLADDRVEAMPGVDHAEGLGGMDPGARESRLREMEAEGFYTGPRVKLRSRQITREHIARMIQQHNARMEQALGQARALLPRDVSEAEEGRLIDIIELARRLRRKLRRAGLEPPEAAGGEPPA